LLLFIEQSVAARSDCFPRLICAPAWAAPGYQFLIPSPPLFFGQRELSSNVFCRFWNSEYQAVVYWILDMLDIRFVKGEGPPECPAGLN
jgi:hypothetical protein